MPAPTKSTLPGLRTGDSGTNRIVVIVASAPMIAASTKIQWKPGPSASTPPSGRPMLEPTAAIAPSSAMPVGIRSRGNSSRMIPNESGNTPPPRPCRPRPMIINVSESASEHTTEPTAKHASAIASSRSLPNMSPRRPKIGVAIEATSRYAVTIHVMPVRRRVQLALDVPERGDHGRLREHEGERAGAEDEQGAGG